jgi:ribosomal protein S18 acetylase RimI-like enzyme
MIDEALLKSISIRQIRPEEPIPYRLLLDADPSREAISKYLGSSEMHIALTGGEMIGVIVLYPVDKVTVEIKNIAVAEKFQGRGVGQRLLEHAKDIAINKKVQAILIGTSNSSFGQLYLYQKAGFDITAIKHNFFLDHYEEPIIENGIQCRHMIMLTKYLD